MRKKNGASILVDTLAELDVKHIFGIPGIHNLDIYDELIECDINHITARNEAGAGFMADGYARSTGKTGVALVITGPGLTNISTAVAEARHDSVPMLVISSQLPRRIIRRDSGSLHELHNSTLLGSTIAKESRCVPSVEEIASYIREAYKLAGTGNPGPVHIEIPLDVLREIPREALSEKEEFARTVRLLKKASSPIIIAGGGSVHAASELKVLAEKLGAPVVTTLGGKGAIPEDHPLSLGTRLHLPRVKALLKQADLVLGVGTQLSPTDLWDTPLELNGCLIQINREPGDFDNDLRADIGICSDAGDALKALLSALTDHSGSPWFNRKDIIETCESELPQILGMTDEDIAFFREIFEAARNELSREGVLVTDMTTPAYLGLSEYPSYAPRTFHHPVGYGTLGYALPAGIGAKISAPDRDICVLSGDGGLQFTIQELAVAMEQNLCLPVIVFNNDGYGEIRRTEDARHPGKRIAVDLENPDFQALSASYGIPSVRARGKEDIAEALRRALKKTGPTIIEVKR